MKLFQRTAIIWLLLFSFLNTFAVEAAPHTIIQLDNEAITSYLETEMRRHLLKGMAVAITQGDEIVLLKGFGSADGGQPVTPQTPFFIGSVSKSFTAMAIMQLVDRGVVALDSPVEFYLPWFTTTDNKLSSQITIRHLLNQTSGLSNNSFRRPRITTHTTLEETVRHLSQAVLTAEPGTQYHYFNPNYNVLAQVIEEMTDSSFPEYIKKHVFAPLEMKHSFVDIEPAQNSGLAQGHNHFFGFALPRQQPFFRAELPAGFLISSAADLAHYMIAQNSAGVFQQTELISAKAVVTMHTPPEGIAGNYAMGWIAQNENGLRTIKHNGSLDSFYADVILLPDHEIGIAVLINQNSLLPLNFVYEPFARGLVDIVIGHEPSRGLSLRLIYIILNALVIYDILRHFLNIKRLSKWKQSVEKQTKSRQIQVVFFQNFLMPILLLLTILVIYIVAGPNAIRIIFIYLIPDIALWLLISAALSSITGVLKIKSLAQNHMLHQLNGHNTSNL